MQVAIIEVGEWRWRGERSGFPQLPDVEPRHSQQHEKTCQVDADLPARWVPEHCIQETSHHNRSFSLITLFSVIKVGDKLDFLFYFETYMSLRSISKSASYCTSISSLPWNGCEASGCIKTKGNQFVIKIHSEHLMLHCRARLILCQRWFTLDE